MENSQRLTNIKLGDKLSWGPIRFGNQTLKACTGTCLGIIPAGEDMNEALWSQIFGTPPTADHQHILDSAEFDRYIVKDSNNQILFLIDAQPFNISKQATI